MLPENNHDKNKTMMISATMCKPKLSNGLMIFIFNLKQLIYQTRETIVPTTATSRPT